MKSGLCLLLLLISGCAVLPTAEQLAVADYGDYPDNYQEVIDSYLAATLKDPGSLKYDHIKGPSQIWNASKYGYGVCGYVNAKNSYGGYTGRRVYFFLLHDGLIIRLRGSGGDLDQEIARTACAADW